MQWGDLQRETCYFPVPATSHARLDICNLAGQKAHFPPSTAAASCALSSSCVVPSLLPPLLAHTDSTPGWFVCGCGRLDVATGLSPCSKQAGGMESKGFSGTVAALCSIYLFKGISLWLLGKVSFQQQDHGTVLFLSLIFTVRQRLGHHAWRTFAGFILSSVCRRLCWNTSVNTFCKPLLCSYFVTKGLSFCVSFIDSHISRDLDVEINIFFKIKKKKITMYFKAR